MPVYSAPLNEFRFLLREVLGIERLSNLSAYASAGPDLLEAVLAEAAKLCEEVLQPLNRIGDQQGCTRHADGSVTTPDGFKGAYRTFVDGGWPSLSCDPEFGGQGMPVVLAMAFNEMVTSSNMAFGMYPGLTHGVYEALHQHGSIELKRIYLPNLTSGEWTGTMNLTEPHCGTDLGLMRTRAEPQADGSFRISGQKIFISAGEHDLAANIIHLVLAKIVGGPEGIRGVSLFVVPKFLVQADGSLGARNGVSCGSIEEKMGIHGNSTCVLNYDGAVGYLVGEEHKGMRAMFTMMNEARLLVGQQGLAVSEVAYQNAVIYARDRLQGRALTGPAAPDKPADPLIVHPDIRRMLMNQKAFNEGARAFSMWIGVQADILRSHATDAERADDYMALLTPVVKAYLTDQGFANCVNAQQVYGGHGYIAEHGMEQFVRDARIAMIYEGANGIQALDLVGRKLGANGGRAVFAFFAEIDALLAECAGETEMMEFSAPLKETRDRLEQATLWFLENGMKNPDHLAAGSTDYLHLFALTALGMMWLRMARAAHAGLKAGTGDAGFYAAKQTTARYFMQRVLPDGAAMLVKIKGGADCLMALGAEAF
ncbi:MAG: acyl-CoA dehydrogenase [Alphaproteobacteria bacterium]|nr:acyl-CoA dehydrogenase [Alphaproteobacteria bacterium]